MRIFCTKGIEVQEAVINFRDEDDTSLPGQVVQPSTIDVSEKFIGSSSPSMEKDSGRFTDGRPCYVYSMCTKHEFVIPVVTLLNVSAGLMMTSLSICVFEHACVWNACTTHDVE